MSYQYLRTPGVKVTFKTVTNPILPTDYTGVTVLGVIGYQIAITQEDITAKFQQMIAYLPDADKDFTKTEYVIIQHTSGDREILALPWIDEGSIETTQLVNKTIKLIGVKSTIDDDLAKLLRYRGIDNFTITTD